MFLPPGTGSLWVPVGEVKWQWAVHVNKGTDQNGNTIWQYAANPTQPSVLGTYGPFSIFEPTFNDLWSNGIWQQLQT
jgi:hypothetical protein